MPPRLLFVRLMTFYKRNSSFVHLWERRLCAASIHFSTCIVVSCEHKFTAESVSVTDQFRGKITSYHENDIAAKTIFLVTAISRQNQSL